MVVSSLEEKITWFYVFPRKNVIYNTLVTSAKVIGTPKIDSTHATLQPGLYVNYNINARSTNNMKTKSAVGVTLRISNKCGDHYFISL